MDPDGKPVAGVRVRGLGAYDDWSDGPPAGASFTLVALHPTKPREVIVLHRGRQLGARLEVKPDAKEPLVVRLNRTGTITGRLLGPDGQPWKSQHLSIYYRSGDSLKNYLPGEVRSDNHGRFRVEGIIPGLTYQVYVAVGSWVEGLVLKPGEVKDLGDVKTRRFRD
jgi:hypothetical protein